MSEPEQKPILKNSSSAADDDKESDREGSATKEVTFDSETETPMKSKHQKKKSLVGLSPS